MPCQNHVSLTIEHCCVVRVASRTHGNAVAFKAGDIFAQKKVDSEKKFVDVGFTAFQRQPSFIDAPAWRSFAEVKSGRVTSAVISGPSALDNGSLPVTFD